MYSSGDVAASFVSRLHAMSLRSIPPLIPLPPPDPPEMGPASASASSDFGDFVSVPPAEDPLAAGARTPTPVHAQPPPTAPMPLLAELLAHEDEPLYFHALARRPATPPSAELARSLSDASSTPLHEVPPSTAPVPIRRHAHGREASLPPSPTQLSAPVLSRAESYSTLSSPSATTSTTDAPTLASSWMSALLSIAPPLPNPPLPKLKPRAQTQPVAHVGHGTPFGAQPFVPASGAPGYIGEAREREREAAGAAHAHAFSGGAPRAGPKLAGRNEGTAPVLSASLASELRPFFPALARLPSSWTLLYSLDQHGISLRTLYTRCNAHTGGALLALRDARGGVFGGWLGAGLRSKPGEGYFGSGESFLWRVKEGGEGGVEVFRWTGRNEYVALCEADYLALGGGDGAYGLYLDDALSDGTSARCPTFDNEPLCAAGAPSRGRARRFECVGCEVWGVGGM